MAESAVIDRCNLTILEEPGQFHRLLLQRQIHRGDLQGLALERDLAATVFAADQRSEHLQRASRLSRRLPGTRAERHLILGGFN